MEGGREGEKLLTLSISVPVLEWELEQLEAKESAASFKGACYLVLEIKHISFLLSLSPFGSVNAPSSEQDCQSQINKNVLIMALASLCLLCDF